MRKFHIAACLMLCAASLPGFAASSVTTNYVFDQTSPLASGRWVKFSITGSGIYEISYDKLREMGFSDPSKVAVYGNGGNQRDINFHSLSGARLVEDSPQAIPMMRYDDKIIFYGQGAELLKLVTTRQGTVVRQRFSRESINAYSDDSFYYLTDSQPEALISTASVTSMSNANTLTSGYGYTYHEEELVNGFHNSGQTWWGEDLRPSVGPVSFNVSGKYCRPNENAVVYADVPIFAAQNGTLTITLNGSVGSNSLSRGSNQLYALTNTRNNAYLNVDANNVGTGTVTFEVSSNYIINIWLDYFTVTYPTSFDLIDKDASFTQFTAGFYEPTYPSWRHIAPQGALVWDISNPNAPRQLPVENGYFYSSAPRESTVVAFRPDRSLRQINDGFELIANQNLHALQHEEVDMVIFTVPRLRDYAERLADIHMQLDGQKCIVLTPQELYNEFNSGTPDPMCYRMFTKMIYQNNPRLKNVLFFGPAYADVRNKLDIPNRVEGMIAYQDNNVDWYNLPGTGMDYYGVMTDNAGSVLASMPITLGVGWLPIDSEQDAELALTKVQNYLSREDYSDIVNEMYAMGGKGDTYLHINQASQLVSFVNDIVKNSFKSDFSHETLFVEGMTDEQARQRILNAMRRGKLFTTYVGHATRKGFDGLTNSDVLTANNDITGFALYAGCDLTYPDKGVHGIGDMGVTRTLGGFIGTFCATRTVLAANNENLARNFYNSVFYDNDNKLRTTTPTIGEVVARAKDRVATNSAVTYIYVGDPAVFVPVALSQASLYVKPGYYRGGDLVTVIGTMEDSYGRFLEDYNGFVTIKLMEPSRTVKGEQTAMKDYTITDLPIISVKGTVKNGMFTVQVPLPETVNGFLGETDGETNLLLLAGTYDNNQRLGGTGRTLLATAAASSEPSEDTPRDTKAPVVTVAYDNELGVVKVKAIDDVAILPGLGAGAGTTLKIDGQDINLSSGHSRDVTYTTYEGTVDVSRLAPGHHTASVVASDYAGNTCEVKTLNFTVTPDQTMKLTAESEVVIDNIDFKLSGGDSKDFRLTVADVNGNVVVDETVSGAAFSLDTTEIAPGTYRASVRRNSPRGTALHSNWVEFTVID